GGFGREMVPLLRSGDYAGAVTLMTSRVASVIAQDAGVTLDNQPPLAATRRQPAPDIGAGTVLVLIFVLFFIVLPILRAIFRGGGRGGFGGGRGGFGGGGFGGGGFGGFGGGSTGGGGAGGSW